MAMFEPSKQVQFVDRADWASAWLAAVFLVVFPIAIFKIWQEPREVAPLIYIVPFTAIFVSVVPYLLKLVLKAQTRQFQINPDSNQLDISVTSLLRRDFEQVPALNVQSLTFETTDNDGFWYSAEIRLNDGRSLCFAQGSYEPGVRNDLARMQEQLSSIRPDIRVIEKKR
jgi:hypothetical protein